MNVEKDDDQGAGDAQAGCQPEQGKSPRKKRQKNMEREGRQTGKHKVEHLQGFIEILFRSFSHLMTEMGLSCSTASEPLRLLLGSR